MNEMRLCDLEPGKSAIITKLENTGDIRRRLIDLGFAQKSRVCCMLNAPLGDPKAYLIKNTLIALRQEDSMKIKIIPCE